ncbi:hypothetical protein GUITHDRAFT_120971 [Guillardia theta CCMP2712]|uniref:PDZ domain-containing protein n=2 Tax=Guillardia theta TaxID=55529 RepID=L1I9A6_GUITC|nr:hypothetical protein GUITHDRAFT_120971 [Guillardia theta CCMP2712]EKX32821.1 hypothetical protein GUITHDRAFT_120971 [Guillardia theta CCMP2712]|eukprot:XP_005819801.1 hypothetical protein GUITHDRAFT_120971 [Guillardia theta CCMP2712]
MEISNKSGSFESGKTMYDNFDDMLSTGSIYDSQEGRSDTDWAGLGVILEASIVAAGGCTWVVEEIAPGSPADLCGAISIGDMLVRVDDVMVAGMQIGEVVKLIIGREGSQVKLEFCNDAGVYSVDLVRAKAAIVNSTVMNLCHSMSMMSPSSSIHTLDSLSSHSHANLRCRERSPALVEGLGMRRSIEEWMATRDKGLHQLTDDERDGEERGRGEGETRETVKGIEGSLRTELKELEESRRGLAEEFELQERSAQHLREQTASTTILSSLAGDKEKGRERVEEREALEARLVAAERLNELYLQEISYLRSQLAHCLQDVRGVLELLEEGRRAQGRRDMVEDQVLMDLRAAVDSPRRRTRLGAVNITKHVEEILTAQDASTKMISEMIVDETRLSESLSCRGAEEGQGRTATDEELRRGAGDGVEEADEKEVDYFDDFALYKMLDTLTRV